MFAPTKELKSVDSDSRSHRWIQVRPDSSAVGANFGGTISLNWKAGSSEYINFAESYVSIRSKWTNGAGAALIDTNNIAMARFGFVNAFQVMQTYVAGVMVERTDYPAQAAIAQHALSKTSSWAETAGSSYCTQATFDDRQQFVLGVVERDVQLSPPQGIWQLDHLVRGAPIRLELVVHPDWESRVAESTGASKTPGTDYNVEVQEVLLWLSVYQPEVGNPDAAPIPCDWLDTVAIRTQATTLNAVTSSQLTFAVESSSYTLCNLLQAADYGTDTLKPVSSTEDGDINSLSVDWQGVRSPTIPFNANWTTQAGTLRLFKEAYIESSVGSVSGPIGGNAGALFSYDEYYENPIFCQKLIGGAGDYDDRVNVELRFNAAFTGILYSQSFYPARILLEYGPDQLVSRVSVAKNDGDIINAERQLQSSF